MQDLPTQGLLQQAHARPISGERLEVLGKHASNGYLSGRYKTLTEAVVETVKQAALSPEQVQRVIEFANTSAFQETFRKEGGAGHKVVDFPGGPADPSVIFRDLNDGGGGSTYDRGLSDYQGPPKQKHASAEEFSEMAKTAFAQEGTPPEYAYAEPLQEAFELREKLAGAESTFTSQLSELEGLYEDLQERAYHQVKQAALSGVSLGEVVQAWSVAEGATPEHVKIAFELFAPRLVNDLVFRTAPDLLASFEKTAANQTPNPEHLLVQEFSDFCDTLSKLAELRTARQEIANGLKEVNLFLKQATTGGLINKVYNVSGKAGELAGHGAAGLTRFLAGPNSGGLDQTVGKYTHKAVEHIPTAGALIAANEARRSLKHSPAVHSALQYVPGTQEYRQREYELAARNMGASGFGAGY